MTEVPDMAAPQDAQDRRSFLDKARQASVVTPAALLLLAAGSRDAFAAPYVRPPRRDRPRRRPGD